MKDKLAENDARAADMQAHMDALRLSNAALQTRNDELERRLGALDDGQDGSPRYDEQTKAAVERGLHLGDQTVISCTVREDRPLYITRAELSTMRQAEFRRLWHLYKDAYVACLVACGNRYDPTLPSVQRLVRLTKELDAMHGVLVLSQPDLIMHFLNGVDEDAPMSAVTAACEAAMQKLNSISIAGAVQLTDRQLEDISQLRSDYLTRYETVMKTLAASIVQVCAVSTHGMANDPQFSRSYLAGAAALMQLQGSLRERYSLEVQVETFFWNSILNTVQSARMSLETYPHHPRVPLIMEALASQQQNRGGQTRATDATADTSSHLRESFRLPFGVTMQPIVEATPG